MRNVTLIALLATSCAPYTENQIALVDQSRKGVLLLGHSMDARQRMIEDNYAMMRQRLDGAFDNDAAEKADLSADWVIEARKAYSAAIDALGSQKRGNLNALDADRANLAAVDAALARLRTLQQVELRLGQSMLKEP